MFLGEHDLEEFKESSKKPTIVGYEKTTLRGSSQTTSQGTGTGKGSSKGSGSGAGETQVMSYGPYEGSFVCMPGYAEGTSNFSSYLEGSSQSSFESQSSSESESEQEAWLPILEEMPTQYFSLEEQKYKAITKLVKQPKQHAFIQYLNEQSEAIKIPTIEDSWASDEMVKKFNKECYNIAREAKYIMKNEVAIQEIERREQILLDVANKMKALPPASGLKTTIISREEQEQRESFREIFKK